MNRDSLRDEVQEHVYKMVDNLTGYAPGEKYDEVETFLDWLFTDCPSGQMLTRECPECDGLKYDCDPVKCKDYEHHHGAWCHECESICPTCKGTGKQTQARLLIEEGAIENFDIMQGVMEEYGR